MNIQQLKKYECEIRQREIYKGRKLKAEQLNGLMLKFEALWLMDENDPYPGEWAMGIVSKTMRTIIFENHKITWMASGDLNFLEEIK